MEQLGPGIQEYEVLLARAQFTYLTVIHFKLELFERVSVERTSISLLIVLANLSVRRRMGKI